MDYGDISAGVDRRLCGTVERRKIKQDEQNSGKNTRKARKRGKILIENEYHTLLDSNMKS